jgi:hypothetical protein
MRWELDASIPPVNIEAAKSHPQKIEGGFFLRIRYGFQLSEMWSML